MMLDCSTVLTFHYRWFVQWEKNSFQPKIGFKTRYGMVANPFAEGTQAGSGILSVNANRYYRRVAVKNLM